MKPEEFSKLVHENTDKDYGICPPPITADQAMNILINHLLGEDWYVVMPLGREQIYTEAVMNILYKYAEKISIKDRIKNIFKANNKISKNIDNTKSSIFLNNTNLDNTDGLMIISSLRNQLELLTKMKEMCINYKDKISVDERIIEIRSLIIKLENNRRINNEYKTN